MWTPSKLGDYSDPALDKAFQEVKDELFGFPAYDREEFRVEWLGRKNGRLTRIREEWLLKAPPDRKREVGQRFNTLKTCVEQHFAAQAAIDLGVESLVVDETAPAVALRTMATRWKGQLASEQLDITLPGIQRPIGVQHPVLRVMDEIVT